MKRDMDLIREILFHLEARSPNDCSVLLPERSMDELRLHLHLMEDAGWITGLSFTRGSAICMRLTNAGYEFLESVKNDTLWNNAKRVVIEKTGGLSIAALTPVVTQLVKAALGLP
jgi:uncharacterized protein DUF2513